MKKLLLILITFIAIPAFAQTLQGGVEFDWISKSQIQRDEAISQIHDILFVDDLVAKYPKKAFRAQYSEFLKDENYREHFIEIKNGFLEDEEARYSAFYIKGNILISYATQFKKNSQNVYYYDAMGNLRYVDIISDNYPNFPYYSYQYRINGQLAGTIYFVSHDDQYVFSPDGKFQGRWYKNKRYDRNAKVTMTRSNW